MNNSLSYQLAIVRMFLIEIASFVSRVNVVNITRAGLLHSFDLPKTVCLEFSPKNNVLATWQAYASEYCSSWGSTAFVHVLTQGWVSTWLLCSTFIG